MYLHDPLIYWSRRHPTNIFANREDGDSVTYGEADAVTEQVSLALAARGLGNSAHIGVFSTNAIEMPLVMLGGSKANCVTVPLNPRLTGYELTYIIHDAQIRALLVGPELTGVIDKVRADLPTVEVYVTTGATTEEGWVTWPEFLAVGAGIAEPSIEDRRSVDPAFQIYTSGTTGRPKGAVMSHRAYFDSLARWTTQGIRMDPGEFFYLPMPITLAAGFNFAMVAWAMGASVTMADYNPERVLEALDTYATATCMSPTMIKRCVEHPSAEGRSFKPFRFLVYGAAPIAANVLEHAIRMFGCDFYNGFGQTECPPISMLMPEDHRLALHGHEELLKTVGRPQLGREMKLVDAAGEVVVPGQIGEVLVRGDCVMTGYWGDAEGTARLAAGGWHHTRDLAFIDEMGYMHVVDRIDDTVISGGYNIYPREIELVLETHPSIAQVSVFGVDDADWGQQLVAAVVLQPGIKLDSEELIAFTRDRLAGYKIPRRFEVLDAFPTNANGKIRKIDLKSIVAQHEAPPAETGA